jgi:hypothetical protein
MKPEVMAIKGTTMIIPSEMFVPAVCTRTRRSPEIPAPITNPVSLLATSDEALILQINRSEFNRELVLRRIELMLVLIRSLITPLTRSTTEDATHKTAPMEINIPSAIARIMC